MSLKGILVHLDNTPGCRIRIDAAIALAERHNAHLTGLYATAKNFVGPDSKSRLLSVAETRMLFEQKTSASGIRTRWLCIDPADGVPDISDQVIAEAFYGDLVIVSQSDPFSNIENYVPRELPERLALGSGRAILILPHTWKSATLGKRIMLAWRGGKASARALSDAIPLMAKADMVNILQVNPKRSKKQDDEKLLGYLDVHGIKATIDKLIADEISTGDMLLNRACDQGIDLIVLGVFARTTFGALGLGPVGKYLLGHMTVPVLMSR